MESLTKLSDEEVSLVAEKVVNLLGYKMLKDGQRRVIVEVIKKRDVFAILPTGYGKSLCYTCMPSLYGEIFQETSIIVVVTPLIAIMKDQVTL